MGKTWSDEAIVLKTYNVGETDRFCVLLTKDGGRIAARAQGVRRSLSRNRNGLLPLHRVHIVCEQHSFGTTITSVQCIDAHAAAWHDPDSFARAVQGIELIIKLIEDGQPVPDVYALLSGYLSACSMPHTAHLPAIFTLKLLSLLGSLPSASHSAMSHYPLTPDMPMVFSRAAGGIALRHEDPRGIPVSPALHQFLIALPSLDIKMTCPCTPALAADILRMADYLLGSQLGVSLAAPRVSLAMSSGVMPICQ